MIRAEEKVPGGKLVRLAREQIGQQARIQISGDFFMHPEDGVYRLEEMLGRLPEGLPEGDVEKAVEGFIEASKLELIGVDAKTIARLFTECCRCGE